MDPIFVQQQNPYAPPQPDHLASSDNLAIVSESVDFAPRILPHSILDVAWQMSLLVLALVFAYGIPIALSIHYGLPPLLPVFAVLFLACLMVATGIRKLALAPEGITVRRNLGTRQFIPWDAVQRVRQASPGELMLAGFLKPHAVCHACMSIRKHVRVDWTGGHFYYPPRDLAKFREFVQHWGAHATMSEMTSPDTSVSR